MRMTPVEYMNWLAKQHKLGAPMPTASPKSEAELHRQIIDYCRAQNPAWLFKRCRMDVPSTVDPGAQDFTIFAPKGVVYCIECKSAKGKLSREQEGWRHRMEMNGHAVHVVRSFEEFMEIVR